MPPLKKSVYIRKALEEADKPLSAQQIGWRLPPNCNTTPHSVAAIIAGMDDISHVTYVVGHGHKRFYYLASNPKIKVEN